MLKPVISPYDIKNDMIGKNTVRARQPADKQQAKNTETKDRDMKSADR